MTIMQMQRIALIDTKFFVIDAGTRKKSSCVFFRMECNIDVCFCFSPYVFEIHGKTLQMTKYGTIWGLSMWYLLVVWSFQIKPNLSYVIVFPK